VLPLAELGLHFQVFHFYLFRQYMNCLSVGPGLMKTSLKSSPNITKNRLCGLVVRVLDYRYGGPGSIPGTTRKEISSGSGTGSTQPREYN
jgi:hypothetical protein